MHAQAPGALTKWCGFLCLCLADFKKVSSLLKTEYGCPSGGGMKNEGGEERGVGGRGGRRDSRPTTRITLGVTCLPLFRKTPKTPINATVVLLLSYCICVVV